MSQPAQKAVQNRLLAAMPSDDFERLRPHLVAVALRRGDILIEPGTRIPANYFPESGIASQIAITSDERRIEVGLHGRDGLSGSSTLLGADRSPHQTLIQVEGHGFRIAAERLSEAAGSSPTLQHILLLYVHVAGLQTAYTALSNGSGVIGERLARWLLMCHDRIEGDDIFITHEFLGVMLGVRRSGVTDAIHVLEGVRIIKATRGQIRILDRARLEYTASDSYGVPEAEYERLIGPLRGGRAAS